MAARCEVVFVCAISPVKPLLLSLLVSTPLVVPFNLKYYCFVLWRFDGIADLALCATLILSSESDCLGRVLVCSSIGCKVFLSIVLMIL